MEKLNLLSWIGFELMRLCSKQPEHFPEDQRKGVLVGSEGQYYLKCSRSLSKLLNWSQCCGRRTLRAQLMRWWRVSPLRSSYSRLLLSDIIPQAITAQSSNSSKLSLAEGCTLIKVRSVRKLGLASWPQRCIAWSSFSLSFVKKTCVNR